MSSPQSEGWQQLKAGVFRKKNKPKEEAMPARSYCDSDAMEAPAWAPPKAPGLPIFTSRAIELMPTWAPPKVPGHPILTSLEIEPTIDGAITGAKSLGTAAPQPAFTAMKQVEPALASEYLGGRFVSSRHQESLDYDRFLRKAAMEGVQYQKELNRSAEIATTAEATSKNRQAERQAEAHPYQEAMDYARFLKKEEMKKLKRTEKLSGGLK